MDHAAAPARRRGLGDDLGGRSERIGIDPLPVGISVTAQKPRFGQVRYVDSLSWKAAALATAFGGRPLAWIDDENDAWHDRAWHGRKRRPSLIVTCDPHVGLTVDQMTTVDEFVDRHLPAGERRDR